MKMRFFKKNYHIEIPRWIILILDQFLLLTLFVISYFSIRQFDIPGIMVGHLLIYLSLYSSLSLISYYLLKVHKGLIRYSNLHDLIKIMKVLFISSISFGLIVQSYWEIGFHTYSRNVNAILLFNFFLASSVLIITRIAIKEVFHFARATAMVDQIRILICGTSHSSVLLKHAIEAGTRDSYFVVGFLSHSKRRVNNQIEQKPVFQFTDLELAIQDLSVKKLLVTTDQLLNPHVSQLIEKCIQLDISVITVPAPDQWISGTLKMNQIQSLKIEDLLLRDPILLDLGKISSLCRGKKILVTGAAGSIGSEIVRQLLQFEPETIILFDQAETPLHEISLEILSVHSPDKIKVFIGDIRNHNRVFEAFSDYRPDIVFHAAAYKHVPLMEENPSEAILTNVMGTKNVADLSLAFGVETFILISSDKAVNPANVMGATKRISEIYIQDLQLKSEVSFEATFKKSTSFIITRFGNVLGSNGSVIPRFSQQIRDGGPITVTHPDITRFFMTIPEAVQLVLEAASMGKGGEIFVFDMGKPVKIKDLALKMIELSGLRPYQDIDIIYTGLRPGEKLFEELLGELEQTLPTHHSLIKIANSNIGSVSKSADQINLLISYVQLGAIENDIIVRKMKNIVLEFISKNSPFENLDAEIIEMDI